MLHYDFKSLNRHKLNFTFYQSTPKIFILKLNFTFYQSTLKTFILKFELKFKLILKFILTSIFSCMSANFNTKQCKNLCKLIVFNKIKSD